MLENSNRLRGRAREIVEDPLSDLRLSVASIWEITIKIRAGRLHLPLRSLRDFEEQLSITNVRPVGLELGHAVAAGALPSHHGDPFDRMLVAQAHDLGIPILTVDSRVAAYDVETIMD